NLEREGYNITLAEDGVQALQALENEDYDMMILDLMLPRMGGMEVIRKVRKTNLRFPILMLTAKATDEDRTLGLEAGADDYLTKPFHLPELMLRIKGILRRKDWYEKPANNLGFYEFGNMWVDFNTGKAKGCDGEFYLTSKETLVMNLLIANLNQVVTREELLEKVWGYSPDTETRTVDNFISRLRKYFEKKPQEPRHIITVREKGYQFNG
ncbi:MAG: response regulator, partial [Nitrospinaceae bacterium]|nr:response regulator transcription factor [Nitrospinaceae bacterium]NIR54256.1 response regulator transcription factor [Nitrospinaceae bacterium]NIS84673.1 response regulator transcription factor [Nitrospinaceae bacterium]NIT81468.1 response regulator transcription factor [Nitrospinaceae bacterium]NIU43752.1 response regulator transcription factor [Nitrospinaceae bacterium]